MDRSPNGRFLGALGLLFVITSHRATTVLRAVRAAQVGAARVDPPDHSGQGEHCRRKADPRPGDVRVSRICCGSVPPEALAWSGGSPHIRTHVADDALNEEWAMRGINDEIRSMRVTRGGRVASPTVCLVGGRDEGRGYRTVRPAVRAKRDAKYGTAQRTGREASAVFLPLKNCTRLSIDL